MSRRGQSLIELVVALLLVFMLCTLLLGLFVSASRNAQRAREFSVATLVAQGQMERALSLRNQQTLPSEGACEAPYQDYSYRILRQPYDPTNPELLLLEVVVVSPNGARSRMVSLQSNPRAFLGVASDPATHLVDMITYTGNLLEWDDRNGSVRDLGPTGATFPTGLAADLGASSVWVAEQGRPGLDHFDKASGLWSPIPGAPADLLPVGVASDGYCNEFWIADNGQNALWRYLDQPRLLGTWTGPLAPAEGIRPSGVASDLYSDNIWVADESNVCLRRYLATGSSPGWDPVLYRPSSTRMGLPRGVAVTPYADRVVTVDDARLYTLEVAADRWSERSLPAALTQARPSGVAIDPFLSLVWINTLNGELWKFDGVAFTRRL